MGGVCLGDYGVCFLALGMVGYVAVLGLVAVA